MLLEDQVKRFVLVMACMTAAGCLGPGPSSAQSSAVEPDVELMCTPVHMTRIAVQGAELFRAAEHWLLRLSSSCGFDLAKLIDAVRPCSPHETCGLPMALPEIDKVLDEVSQAKLERMTLSGVPIDVYRAGNRILFAWDLEIDPKRVLGKLSAMPALGSGGSTGPLGGSTDARTGSAAATPCCPGCAPCDPGTGQCQSGPPTGPRIAVGQEACGACDAVCEANANGELPANCECVSICECGK